jgi:hypothetical protein
VSGSPADKGVRTEARDTVGIRYKATTSEDIESCMCAAVQWFISM